MNKKANAAEAANVNDNEEVVDAKSTQVAPVETTAVSTEVQVQGVQLDFPFIRIGQGMSQWRTAETKNGKPEEGAFYVGRSKDKNVKIAESGKDGGIYGIILDKVDGFKEDRPYSPGNNVVPRRWVVGQTDADGKPMNEEACLTAAAAEGFSLALKPTGEVWHDSGRPKMRANLGRFCYLLMLVPVPETLESDDKSLDQTLGNIKSRADFAFMQEQKKLLREGKIDAEGYKKALAGHRWSVNGLVCHIYSCEATNKAGIAYTTHVFERAMRDGKPWEFTDEEKADFTTFLMSVKAGAASMDDVGGDGEF